MDMLVSDAQVLSALGLALMMVTTVEARGVQMIRVDPIILLAELGGVRIGCLLHFL